MNVVLEVVKASQAGRHVSNRLLRLEVLERLLFRSLFLCLTEMAIQLQGVQISLAIDRKVSVWTMLTNLKKAC
jgi:hypothetical protein